MLSAPIALQALGDLVLAGADARVPEFGQGQTIALTGDDGAQDLLPRLAGHVGDDVGQLDVHLGQGLLHVLYETALAAQQHGTLAAERAQYVCDRHRGVGGVVQIDGDERLHGAVGIDRDALQVMRPYRGCSSSSASTESALSCTASGCNVASFGVL